MSHLASALKSEIARVARRETKGDFESLRKVVSKQRSDIVAIKKELLELAKQNRRLQNAASKSPRASAGATGATEPGKLRFRAAGFATLRRKLGLSANDMGRLIGVTGQSVYLWEAGKTAPRASQLPAIAAVRKMGKRAALAKLSALS